MKKYCYVLIVAFCVSISIPAASGSTADKPGIIGTVSGSGSMPVAGIQICLLDPVFLKEIARTFTDNNGRFILHHIKPGIYLLSVDTAGLAGLMKRVEVLPDAPTFIDIRPYLQEEDRAKHNAWEKFKWTIRTAQRNPLRDEEWVVENSEKPYGGSLAFLKNFQEANNIVARFSYLNIGSDRFDSPVSYQTAQFAVQGELEGTGRWSIHGNFLEGPRAAYMASGDFRYRIFGHEIDASFSANDLLFAEFPELLHRQRIARFMESPEPLDVAMESNRWITSVDLNDEWELTRNFRVGFGTRIDYYGYLQDSVGYSPRIQLSYRISPQLAVTSVYYLNESAPGNYYLQPDSVPYLHDVAFVPYGSQLEPEFTRGFETGIDYSTDDFQFSVRYHGESIQNRIATITLGESPVNEKLKSLQPFVIFNGTDLETHGVEIQMKKRLAPFLVALASYNLTEGVPVYIIEKRSFSNRRLYFLRGDSAEDFHDLMAGIEAHFPQTGTQIQANWKWSSGSTVVFGREDSVNSLSALDIEVHQGIPVQVFTEKEIKLLVLVKNLLDQNDPSNGNADYHRALTYDSPRVFAGGVLIQF